LTSAVLKGCQTPRVTCVPDTIVSSSGRDAVDLARSVGLWLDPWQAHVLEHSLGERADGKWAAFEVALVVGRQNGKGAVLEARELAGLFLFGEQMILHSAHEFKTAQEAFRRVLALIEAKDHLRKRVKRVRTSHGDEGIELLTGQRLRFVARSTGSGRGFSGDLVVLDEAYNLGGEAMAALLPTLSARTHVTRGGPQIWYASSAGMESSEQLLRVHDRALQGGDPRLAYFEWSADPSLGLDSPDAWAQANPALGIRIDEEFVHAERAALPDYEFGRERLGYWPSTDLGKVIPLDLWLKLGDPESQIQDPVVFAAAATPDRSRGAIAVAGGRADGRWHVEVIEYRPGIDWMRDRLIQLNESHRPIAIAIDPGSSCGSIIPGLQEAGIEPELFTGRDRAAACGALYDAVVETQTLRHLNQEALNFALMNAKKKDAADAWVFDRKAGTDISPLDAVALALFGYLKYAKNEGPPNLWI
jgi:phage terminase large subunit-like protein